MPSTKYAFTRVVPSKTPTKKTVKFPKAKVAKAAANKKFNNWAKKQKAKPAKAQAIKFKPIAISAPNLKKIVAVREAPIGTAAIQKEFKGDLGRYLGTTYSAIILVNYIEMQGAYKKAIKNAAGNPKKIAAAKKRWQEHISAARANYKAAGGAVSEAKLAKMAQILVKNKKALNEVINMKQSAKSVSGQQALTVTSPPKAVLNTITTTLVAPSKAVIPVPIDICGEPIEGSYTQHYSNSFNLDVTFTYWCPTWTKPWKTCRGTITLAGISFTLGIDVGYRVTCCGGTVWGAGLANACGTAVGITVCAGCTGAVVGVLGVGRTPIGGGMCEYGLGATAQIECAVGSKTVFSVSYVFGWVITAPCPPAALPC